MPKRRDEKDKDNISMTTMVGNLDVYVLN